MTSILIALTILSSIGAFVYFKARKSGKQSEQLKNKESHLKNVENEADAWREKPVVGNDIDDELHKLSKNANSRKP